MNDRRWLVGLAAALALTVALWEIDPRWITEDVGGLNTREQGEANQAALGGSQGIAWVAVPASMIVFWFGWRLKHLASKPAPLASGRTEGVDWLGLWVVWSLVGGIFSPTPLYSFGFTASAAALLLGTRVLTRARPELTAAAAVGALGLFVTMSLLVKFAGLATVSVRTGRLTLLSLEANQFGRMASMATLAGLFLAFEGNARSEAGAGRSALAWRIAGSVTAVGALAALVMTGSRTGLAATAAALLVLVLAKRSRAALATLATVGVLAIVALSLSDVGTTSLDTLQRGSGDAAGLSSLTGRTDIWPVVLETAAERPLVGYGMGTTTALLSPKSNAVGFTVEHTHNLLLHLTVTTGVVGAVLVVIALARAVARSSPSRRPWVMAIITYVAIAGVSEAVLRNPDISLMLVVFAVVLAEAPEPAHHLQPNRQLDRIEVTQ